MHGVARRKGSKVSAPGARLGRNCAGVLERRAGARDRGAALRQLGETVNDARLSVTGGSGLDAEPMLPKASRLLDPRLHPGLGFRREHNLSKALVAGADLALGHAEFFGSAGLSGRDRLERAGEGDDGARLDRAAFESVDPVSVRMALKRRRDGLFENGSVGVIVF